jgi:hypothetical protein
MPGKSIKNIVAQLQAHNSNAMGFSELMGI